MLSDFELDAQVPDSIHPYALTGTLLFTGGVQLKVRVGLRCLVEDLAPVIVPTSVSPKNAQGQHLLEVFHLPPRPRNLEPALHHVTMGALDGARTDGQTCRPSTLVIQVIRMVDEIAVAGANRGLGVRNAGRFHEGLETSHHLRPA